MLCISLTFYIDFTDVWGEGSIQYSEKVIRAYMCHYATSLRLGHHATDEDIARIYKGGPNGWNDSSTLDFWIRVSAVLTAIRNGMNGKLIYNIVHLIDQI